MNQTTNSTSVLRTARTRFSCAICGAGPSGMGFLFHAFKTGKLPEIARNGLLIIDRRTELGAGKLGEYVNVSGNTVGNTFLACVEHENFEEVFADMRENSPLYRQMVEAADGPPRLTDAGAFLALATEELLAYLTARYDVTVLRGHEIEKIRRLPNGGFEIDCHDVNNPTVFSRVSSDTVVMNLGGQQRVDEIDDLCLGLRLLPPHASVRTYVSDDVLSLTTEQLIDEFASEFSQQGTRRPNRITVIGGSHSAFTVVDRLAMELGSEGLDEIAVIHRSQVRLFFETVEEAHAHGYKVDEANDVCPVTKRVNRAGGLRYRAFDIARAIMADGYVPDARTHVELIEADSSDAARSRARECLRESIAVIHGAGYGPRMSILVDDRDTPIPLQVGQGGIVSDRYGCPFDASGKLVRGLFSFGLGSGFHPDEQIRRETGFEAAFRGRIYGVWAFHHDFGGRVMNGVLEALATVPGVCQTEVALDEGIESPEAPQLAAYEGPRFAISAQASELPSASGACPAGSFVAEELVTKGAAILSAFDD